jgi:FAD/FMN-containing dehydrogenase
VGSYSKAQGCKIGALPQYIVNTTQEADVAVAMKWAADRNIRIVVKGTGHDLNGRYVYTDLEHVETGNLTMTYIDQAAPSPYPSGRATSAT